MENASWIQVYSELSFQKDIFKKNALQKVLTGRDLSALFGERFSFLANELKWNLIFKQLMEQVTSHVLMIRPSAFGYNVETAENNVFQHKPENGRVSDVTTQAIKEFDDFVQVLEREGIHVTIIEDSQSPQKPDAVFPNNWISFHQDGTVITYPMYSRLRREERREEIIQELADGFKVGQRVHFEIFEKHHQYLEGTGSMVLDHVHKKAYACISERTDPGLLVDWCRRMEFKPHTFHAVSYGIPIYHTNVMMAIGSKVAVVCLECLPDDTERALLKESLSRHHAVVEITDEQVQSFAGNMLALKNRNGEELMVMSARAYSSLSREQKTGIEKYCRIVAAPIQTIEDVGGGSARCMIAEIFLEPK